MEGSAITSTSILFQKSFVVSLSTGSGRACRTTNGIHWKYVLFDGLRAYGL